MTEMVPPLLGATPTTRPVTRPDHLLRLCGALHEHNGFTARALPGTLAVTHSDCADPEAVHVFNAGSRHGTPTE
ncbi:hypothetical protein ABZW30_36025 [Kitasatospora sp. NPDC004669]|uniref:hypothetical protein n=1 Tax=Kitasatospora sp. NPDC004669 TaxID=3154555 RepID=UPI0033A11385